MPKKKKEEKGVKAEELNFEGVDVPGKGLEGTTLTPEQLKDVQREIELEKKFGDSPIKAAAAGAASGLTLGISDQALVRSGLVDAETLQQLARRNRAAAITGEIAGTIAPLIATGGASAAAKAASIAGKGVTTASTAGRLAEKGTEKLVKRLISKSGNPKTAKKVLEKAVPKVAGSAVEGSFFGTGQLISENALGNAEFNAENLLTSAGSGAVFGGLAGAGLGAAQALTPIVSKGASKIKGAVKDKTSKFLDPEDAALEFLGYTPAKKTKFKKNNPDMVAEIPDYLVKKGKAGLFTGAKDVADNIRTDKEASGKIIGDILNTVDEIGQTNQSILPSMRQVYTRITNKLDDEFINKLKDTPGFSRELRPIRQIRDDFAKLANNDKKLTATSLQKLRQDMDKLAGLSKELGKKTLKEKAALTARRALREEIDNLAERAAQTNVNNKYGNIFQELKDANRDYSIASQILPNIEQKLDKDKFFSLTDLLFGGLAGAGGIKGALGGIVTKKIIESDARRRLTILSAVERQNAKVTKKLDSSVSNFLKGAKAATVPVSTKILLESGFSYKLEPGKKPKKPSNKLKAFENMSENLTKASSDPKFLEDVLIKGTARLTQGAPETATAVQDTIIRAIQFLNSKLPRDNVAQIGIIPNQRKYQPSDLDLAKFERYVQAVENPLSVLSDLENGSVTREQVEAIQVVYPNLYERIREKTMEKLVESEDDVSYNRRVQLGILLNIPSDPSLLPQNIAGLQSTFIEQNQPPVAQDRGTLPKRGTESLDIAERERSEAQKIATRD